MLANYTAIAQEAAYRKRVQRWTEQEYITLASEMQRAWDICRSALSTALAATSDKPADIDGHLADTFNALFGPVWSELRRRADDDGIDISGMVWPIEVEKETA